MVLDLAAPSPGILRKDLVSGSATFAALPPEARRADGVPAVMVSSISLDDDQEVIAHGAGPARHLKLAGPSTFRALGAVSRRQRAFSVEGGDLTAGRAAGVVTVDGEARALPARPGTFVGGAKLLDVAADGGYWVLVDEVDLAGAVVHVTQTVRQFDAGGRFLGLATVPLDDRVVHVNEGVQVGPDGEVYALVPKERSVEIVRLPVVAAPEAVEETGTPVAPMALRPEGDLDTTAWRDTWHSYTKNLCELSDVNIHGACAQRVKPHYLVNAGTYPSVPYDWGGFDLPGEFNAAMAAGKQAGDITSGRSEGCSHGIDCSGYVSRVWQLDSKKGTSTLPDVGHEVTSREKLVLWDIFNNVDKHTVMFIGFQDNGFYGTESTTTDHFDCVVNRNISWDYVNGYTTLRSNTLQGYWPT